MTPRPVLLTLLYSLCLGQAVAFEIEGEIVDLTHPFSAESIYWPTADGFSLEVDSQGMTEKGYYYSANSFAAAEHGGTHLDSPIHFAAGKSTVDEISLDRLIAPGVIVDLSEQVQGNSDFQIQAEDLMEWERRHGQIPDGSILLLYTGWSAFYPDAEQYLGTAARGEGAVADLHFPGLDPEAAQWLVEHRKIAAIGLDTASIDYGQSDDFRSHQILFEAEIPAFENVANLDSLPPTGSTIIALPMKIKGGSGAPLRIVAIVPN